MSKQTGFKQQLQELEKIVAWFESGDVDVDEAVEKFDRGMKLAGSLEARLKDIESKVTELKQKHDLPDADKSS